MAEAIGIASAAISFLDLTIKILAIFGRIRNATDNQPEDDADIIRLIDAKFYRRKDLRSRESRNEFNAKNPSEEEKTIYETAADLQRIEEGLRTAILSRRARSRAIWDVSEAVFRAVWNESDEAKTLQKIKDRRNLLFMLQVTLTQKNIQKNIRESEAALESKLDWANGTLGFIYTKLPGIAKQESVEALEARLDRLREQQEEQTRLINSCSLNTSTAIALLRKIGQNCDASSGLKVKRRQLDFLDKLEECFGHKRYSLLNPHSDSLKWLLDDTDRSDQGEDQAKQLQARHEIRSWFSREDGGILYFSGKPGAGKSTLMKVLYSHPKAIDWLQTWAGEGDLCRGEFFFFRPEGKENNSLFALKSAILHKVMFNRPGLIEKLFKKKWDNVIIDHQRRVPRFEYAEITKAFDKLIEEGPESLVRQNHKFAFFIGGLDEFERQNEESYSDVALCLSKWTESWGDSLKLCVSGRANVQFVEDLRVEPAFFVNDLTRGMMMDVARMRLENERKFFREFTTEQDRKTAIYEVVDRAEGIFLWLHIVLAQLEAGLKNDDRKEDFERKLQAYPADLGPKLFVEIFKHNKGWDGDLKYATRSLKFVAETEKRGHDVSSAYVLSFERCESNESAQFQEQLCSRLQYDDRKWKQAIRELEQDASLRQPELEEDEEVLNGLNRGGTGALKRMVNRSRCLLESASLSRNGELIPVVRLAHRSVGDFLETKDYENLDNNSLEGYDWRMPFCQGWLLDQGLSPEDPRVSYLQSPPRMDLRTAEPAFHTVEEMMHFMVSSTKVDEEVPTWFVDLLRAVDEAQNAECIEEMGGLSRCPTVKIGLGGTYEIHWGDGCRQGGHVPIDLLAAQAGLYEYLKEIYALEPSILADTPRMAATMKCILGLTVARRYPTSYDNCTKRGLTRNRLLLTSEKKMTWTDTSNTLQRALSRTILSLRLVLSRGCQPLYESNSPYSNGGDLSYGEEFSNEAWDPERFSGSPWDFFLANILEQDELRVFGPILDLFMEMGFKPDCRFYLVSTPNKYYDLGDKTESSPLSFLWFESPDPYRTTEMMAHSLQLVLKANKLSLLEDTGVNDAGFKILSLLDIIRMRNIQLDSHTRRKLEDLMKEIQPVDTCDPVGLPPRPGQCGKRIGFRIPEKDTRASNSWGLGRFTPWTIGVATKLTARGKSAWLEEEEDVLSGDVQFPGVITMRE